MSLNQLKSITLESPPKGFAEKRIDVITNNRALYSKQDFNANDVIAEFFWKSVHSTPSYLTVQVSDHEHIELLPEYLECVNHSCDPNCFFNTALKQFIALKPIKEGEELTFFYPSSEWDMGQAFRCGTRPNLRIIFQRSTLNSSFQRRLESSQGAIFCE